MKANTAIVGIIIMVAVVVALAGIIYYYAAIYIEPRTETVVGKVNYIPVNNDGWQGGDFVEINHTTFQVTYIAGNGYSQLKWAYAMNYTAAVKMTFDNLGWHIGDVSVSYSS